MRKGDDSPPSDSSDMARAVIPQAKKVKANSKRPAKKVHNTRSKGRKSVEASSKDKFTRLTLRISNTSSEESESKKRDVLSDDDANQPPLKKTKGSLKDDDLLFDMSYSTDSDIENDSPKNQNEGC